VKFEVNLIYFKTLAALRPRTLFRSFYYTKNRTLTALSNFRGLPLLFGLSGSTIMNLVALFIDALASKRKY